MMKDEKEKIDLLFQQNGAEQLAGVDWDKLNAAISSRLDQAQEARATVIKFPVTFKVAAAVAAAAVIFIVVLVATNRPADMKLQKGSRVVVKFMETKGSASVEIKHVGDRGQAVVDIGPDRIKLAKCYVKITDLNGDWEKADQRPSWIIVKRTESLFVNNGANTDMMDMICLF